MVSTRKKTRSNRRLLSQLDDFDQNFIMQEITTVSEGGADQEFTVCDSDGGQTVNENVVNVKTLEKCFDERTEREMGNIFDTVEDKIQNAILTAIGSIIIPKIEFAYRSKNASSERDATSVMANSECGEHIGIIAPLENVSERKNTLHVLNINHATRNEIPDGVSELSVPDTHVDRNHKIVTDIYDHKEWLIKVKFLIIFSDHEHQGLFLLQKMTSIFTTSTSMDNNGLCQQKHRSYTTTGKHNKRKGSLSIRWPSAFGPPKKLASPGPANSVQLTFPEIKRCFTVF